MNELFGVRHQLDVGMVDPVTDDAGRTRLHPGLRRPEPGAPRSPSRSRATSTAAPTCRSSPTTAEVIATDAHGRPALLRRQAGRGSLILCTYPLEYMASAAPGSIPTRPSPSTVRSPRTPGVRRPVSVDEPGVACDVLVRQDGTRFAVIASHVADEVTVKPTPRRVRRTMSRPVG